MGFTSELSTNANPPDGLYAVLSGMTITPWPMLLQVMLFQPIALDEQAKDLLRAGQYEQALHLAGICAADGAPWAETAFAETALLLLHGRLPLEPSIKPTPPPSPLCVPSRHSTPSSSSCIAHVPSPLLSHRNS